MTIPIFLLANAQDTAVYLSDPRGKKIKERNLGYIAKRWKENDVWHIIAFSYPSKMLQLDGYYNDLDCKQREGRFINYYEDGMMKDFGLFVKNK